MVRYTTGPFFIHWRIRNCPPDPLDTGVDLYTIVDMAQMNRTPRISGVTIADVSTPEAVAKLNDEAEYLERLETAWTAAIEGGDRAAAEAAEATYFAALREFLG